MRRLLAFYLLLTLPALGLAQSKSKPLDKFKQLEEILPTPTEYRAASGAPGHKYWQQRADYKIDVELDDAHQKIFGSETITYTNNSPDTLTYLWLQLDQNLFAKDSDTYATQNAPALERLPYSIVEGVAKHDFDGGYKITSVKDATGAPLKSTIIKTMMRIDLKTPLASGQTVSFSIDWNNNINDQRKLGGAWRL